MSYNNPNMKRIGFSLHKRDMERFEAVVRKNWPNSRLDMSRALRLAVKEFIDRYERDTVVSDSGE